MTKLKLMTIVGTRPEVIKLSEVIKSANENFDHVLVHTGQNYDYSLNKVFFEDLKIPEPSYYLNVVGDTLGETIGNIISKSYDLLIKEKPDALLVLGDTNSCLSVISAKRLKIPIFHMEAGNRCFDENLPEETNRKIVDHTSDVNLCYTEHARRYLNNEGRPSERTFVVGSPMPEILKKNKYKINKSQILNDLNLNKDEYILLSAHREENLDQENNFLSLMNAINKIAEKYNVPIIYSVHPRSEKIIEKHKFEFNENVVKMNPFGFSDYINLQKNALCVISDSGTLAEEASYFNFPAVSIRTSTERPEVIDSGNMIIGNITYKELLQSVDLAINLKGISQEDKLKQIIGEIEVSTKVIKIIQSYTRIVDKEVWKK